MKNSCDFTCKRHTNLEISSSAIRTILKNTLTILKNTQTTIWSCHLSLTRSPICVDLSMCLTKFVVLSLIATTMVLVVVKDIVAVANVTATIPRYLAVFLWGVVDTFHPLFMIH